MSDMGQSLTPEQNKAERAVAQHTWEGLLQINEKQHKLTPVMELLIRKTLRQLSKLEQMDRATERAAEILGLKDD
jgi:hypothetical protein